MDMLYNIKDYKKLNNKMIVLRNVLLKNIMFFIQ